MKVRESKTLRVAIEDRNNNTVAKSIDHSNECDDKKIFIGSHLYSLPEKRRTGEHDFPQCYTVSMQVDQLLDDAHLRYTSDKLPGIRRIRSGKGFTYQDTIGKTVTDKRTLKRIKALVLPPAWNRVWISPYANGHLQATGMDAKKRKQYRYHPKWIEVSQHEKFTHILDFAKALPTIRTRVQNDLVLRGMQREKVLAAIVWLLENTYIRIGNAEYEKENKHYGLTTLKNTHADIDGNTIKFEFKGKSGVYHKVKIKSKRVASVVRKCQELPGQDLFEYRDDDGVLHSINSSDVNAYLKEISGREITAKDFRTWAGTVLAAEILHTCGVSKKKTETKQNLVDCVKKVAHHLRNKPATARKYYVHPLILEGYSRGKTLSKTLNASTSIEGLNELENKVVQLLTELNEE